MDYLLGVVPLNYLKSWLSLKHYVGIGDNIAANSSGKLIPSFFFMFNVFATSLGIGTMKSFAVFLDVVEFILISSHTPMSDLCFQEIL